MLGSESMIHGVAESNRPLHLLYIYIIMIDQVATWLCRLVLQFVLILQTAGVIDSTLLLLMTFRGDMSQRHSAPEHCNNVNRFLG